MAIFFYTSFSAVALQPYKGSKLSKWNPIAAIRPPQSNSAGIAASHSAGAGLTRASAAPTADASSRGPVIPPSAYFGAAGYSFSSKIFFEKDEHKRMHEVRSKRPTNMEYQKQMMSPAAIQAVIMGNHVCTHKWLDDGELVPCQHSLWAKYVETAIDVLTAQRKPTLLYRGRSVARWCGMQLHFQYIFIREHNLRKRRLALAASNSNLPRWARRRPHACSLSRCVPCLVPNEPCFTQAPCA
eukprot:2989041-Pleurochrysis_carterae.AAC.1